MHYYTEKLKPKKSNHGEGHIINTKICFDISSSHIEFVIHMAVIVIKHTIYGRHPNDTNGFIACSKHTKISVPWKNRNQFLRNVNGYLICEPTVDSDIQS